MAKFLNLTPHHINMPDGTVLEPSGILARCEEVSTPVGSIDGNAIITRRYGQVENLPAPEGDVYFIVSHMTRVACPDRLDLLSPGDLVRDEAGNIIGCRNLVINSLNR
jgi:hypothetical protein